MASHRVLSVFILMALAYIADAVKKKSGDTVININGNLVKIVHKCPHISGGEGMLEVTSDLSMYVVAICQNGKRNFTRIDSATQRLIIDIAAGDNEPDRCSLYKRHRSEVYTLAIHGGWGEQGREVMMPELRRTVICAYDNYTQTDKQKPVSVNDYIIAPRDLPNYKGKWINLKIDMSLVNIIGASLDGKRTSLGRLVRLRAYALDRKSPIKPLSCYASNNRGKRYYILRAGCGDGLVFRKNVGFKYDRFTKTSWSPFFRSFSLPRSNVIYFMCHFIVCDTDCGNDSCANERKRRDALPQNDLGLRDYKTVDTATGYVVVRKVVPSSRLSDLDLFSQRLTDAAREDSATSTVFVILGVLGAMLLVTMCMLIIVCARHPSPLHNPAPQLDAKTPQELNNNLAST